MGHRDDCLSPDYARELGREDWRSGWYSPYAQGDCYEAQQAYDEGARYERRLEQARREERERMEYEEMAYYAQAQREQDEYDAWCEQELERQYASAMYFEEQEYLWHLAWSEP